MAKAYPPEFRKKVLDLLDAGRTVADVAADLGVTGQTIYNWRNQHLIDTGRREASRALTMSSSSQPGSASSGSRPTLPWRSGRSSC